jgi:hypothetical protein
MRHFTMAIPTEKLLVLLFSAHADEFGLMNEIGVATLAVFLNYFHGPLLSMHHLRLQPKGEDVGVPKAIAGFEKILAEKIILRNVAIGASGNAAVAAVFPRGVLRQHDVTVDARLGVTGHIRNGVRDVQCGQ